jgi:hypothetical protein
MMISLILGGANNFIGYHSAKQAILKFTLKTGEDSEASQEEEQGPVDAIRQRLHRHRRSRDFRRKNLLLRYSFGTNALKCLGLVE